MNSPEQLNALHGLTGTVAFETGQGGLTRAVITNASATAEIYLQGATVTAYQPRGESPVLWLSPQAQFQAGKAIRGGIPVCWPWFGPHPKDASKPQHGFARNLEWSCVNTRALSAALTEVELRLTDSDATRALWPHAFELTLRVTVGDVLQLDLTARNPGPEPVELGAALHSYFHVGDIREVEIHGLERTRYFDQVAGNQEQTQAGPVNIGEEVDRIYFDTEADCVIRDPNLNRSLRVAKLGSRSTVVWNPWIAKSGRMADFPDDGYRTMVCVETTNAARDLRTLSPGDEHTLTQIIGLESPA